MAYKKKAAIPTTPATPAMAKPATPARTAAPLKGVMPPGRPPVEAGSHTPQPTLPLAPPVVQTAGNVEVTVAHDEVGAYGEVSRW